MKYLLDTNIVIDHIRGKKIIDKNIIKEGIGISIITFGELLYGAQKSTQKEKSLTIISSLIKELSMTIINLDKEIMAEYSILKALLEIKGKRLDNFDLLIAATAIKYSLPLSTSNTKHFSRIPNLRTLNSTH